MDKKRETILFPLGFNNLPVTAIAYNIRLKNEIREEFEQKLAELKKEQETRETELREKLTKEIYNELYEKLSEKFRRDDIWEHVETESK